MENQVQEDEIESLEAIYGDDFQLLPTTTDTAHNAYSISVTRPDSRKSLSVQITCPDDYPSNSPPVYELRNSEWLDGNSIQQICEKLVEIYKESQGEVVVYQWVECIRDFIATKISEEDIEKAAEEVADPNDFPPAAECGGSTVEPGVTDPELDPGSVHQQGSEFSSSSSSASGELSGDAGQCPDILHGEPVTDRKSTFQAHAAAVTSRQEVARVMAELKKNKKIASATHNILAYRLLDSRGVLVQDCDEDGETAAGGRLLHLIQMMDVRNAMVVVSRWYGGVLMYGDRFKHINNVARILLQETGLGLKHKEAKPVGMKGKKSKQSK